MTVFSFKHHRVSGLCYLSRTIVSVTIFGIEVKWEREAGPHCEATLSIARS